jgi:GNAT superfamily N-acetyltransferase
MIHLRPLTAADLPLGLHLSRQAGWNQTPDDWRRCLGLQPDGCFVAECDGAPAGTTTTCVFGRVAWVAMVLVEERFRRRGVGRALMEHALAFLDGQGVRTVRLDATPVGQPLYEQLGFRQQFRLDRYDGVLPPDNRPAAAGVVTAPPGQWEGLAALDAAVTRTDRRTFLLRLFAERPGLVRAVVEADGLRGFTAARIGSQALQIGPCVGPAGAVLLEDACRRHAGRRIYLDVPEANRQAADLATARGLTVQRRLVRMCRGEPVVEREDLLWTSSGPEKG